MITVDQALDSVMQLPREQRQMLIELMHGREIEERRAEIAQAAQAALSAFRAGQLPSEPLETLLTRLHTTAAEQDD